MCRIEAEIGRSIEARERYRSLLGTVRSSVVTKLEQKLVDHVKSSMFSPYRDAIIEKLNNLRGNISGDIVTQALESCLPANYMNEFWEDLTSYTITMMKELWGECLDERIEDIEKINSILLPTNFSAAFSDEIRQIKETTNILSDEVFRTGIQASLGIAGVATAYAALLGPAAAYITIGAAASGIGIPIALMGAGVSAALYFLKSKNKTSKGVDGNEVLNHTIEQFTDSIIRNEYMKHVRDLNLKTEEALIKKYETTVCSKLPDSNLDRIAVEVKRMKDKLSAGHESPIFKGVVKDCSFCGKEIKATESYCPGCGRNLLSW